MITIDYKSQKAIYEQIYDEITKLILSKSLKSDDKLPSVRELASLIKINPNTIQKAYRFLELNNFIYTIKGRGNYVKNNEDLRKIHIKKINEKLLQNIKSLKELGVDNDKILEIVNRELIVD